MLPAQVPAAVGSKLTLSVRVCAGGSITAELGAYRVKPVPLAVICEIFTLAVPVFVMAILCDATVPVLTVPKFRLAGDIESTTTGDAEMVKLRAWLAVSAGELESVNSTVKMNVPADVGVPVI